MYFVTFTYLAPISLTFVCRKVAKSVGNMTLFAVVTSNFNVNYGDLANRLRRWVSGFRGGFGGYSPRFGGDGWRGGDLHIDRTTNKSVMHPRRTFCIPFLRCKTWCPHCKCFALLIRSHIRTKQVNGCVFLDPDLWIFMIICSQITEKKPGCDSVGKYVCPSLKRFSGLGGGGVKGGWSSEFFRCVWWSSAWLSWMIMPTRWKASH